MDQFSGGNWSTIPNSNNNYVSTPIPNSNNNYVSTTPSNQDHNLLDQQQQFQYQQQQHFQPQPQQPPLIVRQPFQPQPLQPPRIVQQPQLQQQQQQNQQHQSLPSHFHLSPLVEKLADVIENGTRDQQSDSLVTEVNNHFERCQQLLNSISDSISSRGMTVDGQKQKLEETEQMLTQRRDLIAKYKNSIEDMVKTDPSL